MPDKKRTSDLGRDQVQSTVDQETEQGFSGDKIDPTPDDAYTVAGSVNGAPTPETDAKQAARAEESAGLGGEA